MTENFTETYDKVEDNFNLVKHEIADIDGRHQKLKTGFDGHKQHSENINRQNVEEFEKIECTLQLLNESKNSLEKDVEHLKQDVKTNENSRQNQEKLQTDRLDHLNDNQRSCFDSLTRAETDLRMIEEKMKIEKKSLADEFRKTEIKIKDTEGAVNVKMKSFKETLDQDQKKLHGQVSKYLSNQLDNIFLLLALTGFSNTK